MANSAHDGMALKRVLADNGEAVASFASRIGVTPKAIYKQMKEAEFGEVARARYSRGLVAMGVDPKRVWPQIHVEDRTAAADDGAELGAILDRFDPAQLAALRTALGADDSTRRDLLLLISDRLRRRL